MPLLLGQARKRYLAVQRAAAEGDDLMLMDDQEIAEITRGVSFSVKAREPSASRKAAAAGRDAGAAARYADHDDAGSDKVADSIDGGARTEGLHDEFRVRRASTYLA